MKRLTKSIIGDCIRTDTFVELDEQEEFYVHGRRLTCEQIYERLAELEDKLESGKLVDTTDYFIEPEKKLNGKYRYLICKYSASKGVYDFADTKEEAEARLKELQENK